ncbi:MAG: hypothetical protein NTW87_32400, partial [Planctomycetota bacterium]|nr:hypothetical protein [Planctomycetota bacterium]
PLKSVAIETVTVSDPQAVFAAKGDGYSLILPKPGEYTLTLAFSVRVDSKPGIRKIEFGIPPTAVSRLELTIPEKDLQVEVMPKMAATVATPEGENTKLLAFVGNAADVSVTWMPPVSKVAKGEAVTIASQAMHVELGERILRLDTAISYKIERNEEDAFRVRVPTDMRLLSVKGGNIREWNTENNVLLVKLHSAVKDSYALALRFERVLTTTPEKLEVPFPAVLGVLREDGYITVAQEAALRLRVESSGGLSQIDPRELPEALKRANLLACFRYLAQPVTLALKIESVLPQIQSDVKAVASLGLDEDAMLGWVEYQIAKVGIFTLRLKFENRWEPVTIGEPQTVEDFQTAADGQYKVLTVNLKNKAFGTFRLPFKLTGAGRAAPGQLTLEAPQVLDTQQDKGLFGVSAPKAFKLTTLDRNKMSSANVQLLYATGLLSQLPADFDLPLAYSYNQQPANVKVSLERRPTEIRPTGYHTVIISEAGLEMTHKLEFVVDFAAVDKLQFSAPTDLDKKLLDVKCPGLKERKIVGTKDNRSIWEISLQDKVMGSVSVTIAHKENLKWLEPEKPQDIKIPDIHAENANPQRGYVAVRKESALEITALDPEKQGFQLLEAANLPVEMRSSNVYLAYQYVEPGHELGLRLTRHEPLEVAKVVVDLMVVTFVVSEEMKLTARAELWVENTKSEQFLELKLWDKEASVRAVAVNGVPGEQYKREGGGTLVKLPSGGGPFPVLIIYSVPLGAADAKLGALGRLAIRTPEVLEGDPTSKQGGAGGGRVPVNKVEAELYVPPEYAYMGFSGTLHPRSEDDYESRTLAWINSVVGAQRQGGDRDRGLLRSFPTEGRLFRFQTLAPIGTVSFSYCGRKLFWLLDILVFIAALALGWYVTSQRHGKPGEPKGEARHRLPLPRLWTCLAFILIPLCVRWFAISDFREPFTAWYWAGLVLAAAFLAVRLKTSWLAWREARLASGPDPFLEEAPEHPAGPETPVAPAEAKAETEAEPANATEAEPPPAAPPGPAEAPKDSGDKKKDDGAAPKGGKK